MSQHLLGMTLPEIYANARLIAAAPELLEALKALLSAFDATGKRLYSISGKPTSRDLSVAAIAKAEGKQ